MLAALAGCSAADTPGPVAWWHSLEGGAIAAQRPPPPGATDPYPNLASVPPRPPAVDPALPRTIGAGLELDRVRAAQAAADNPLTPPPAAPPAAPAAPPAAGAPTARVAAAEAPPPPPAAAPAPPQASAAAAPPGPLPAVPRAPPPPPALSNLAMPMTLPDAAIQPAAAADGPLHLAESVIVAFPLGSAALPPQASASLRALAARRHGAPVAVEAHGEAAATALPEVQQQALALGLQRAQAMADTLVAAGVPVADVRIAARAVGRGGTARLLD